MIALYVLFSILGAVAIVLAIVGFAVACMAAANYVMEREMHRDR